MEGRIVTLEFKDFYFSTVYTPNAGDGLKDFLIGKFGIKIFRILSRA